MEKIKRNKKIVKEYLVLWEGYPIEEASWILAEQFSYPGQLREFLEGDNPYCSYDLIAILWGK